MPELTKLGALEVGALGLGSWTLGPGALGLWGLGALGLRGWGIGLWTSWAHGSRIPRIPGPVFCFVRFHLLFPFVVFLSFV